MTTINITKLGQASFNCQEPQHIFSCPNTDEGASLYPKTVWLFDMKKVIEMFMFQRKQ